MFSRLSTGNENSFDLLTLENSVLYTSSFLEKHTTSGEHLVLSMGNSPLFAIIFLAGLRSRRKLFPVSPDMPEEKIRNFAAEIDSRFILSEKPSLSPEWFEELRKNLCRVKITPKRKREDSLTGCQDNGRDLFSSLFSELVKADLPDNRDGAVFLKTSGSCGEPKLRGRSILSLIDESHLVRKAMEIEKKDTVFTCAPFHHAYGLVDGLLAPLVAGATIATGPKLFTIPLFNALRDSRATICVATPPFYRALLDLGIKDTSFNLSLKKAFSAGMPLSKNLFKAFKNRFGVPILSIYGLTEVGTVSVQTVSDLKDDDDSVGKPIHQDGVRILIENGDSLIEVRDTSLDPENKTWLRTGDLGTLDIQGRIKLKGRKSLFINFGGEKLDPQKIESELISINGILEALVLSRSDERYGEVPVAVVRLAEDFSQPEGDFKKKIISLLRSRLEPSWIPREIYSVKKSLPRNDSGKLKRNITLVDILEEKMKD